MASRMCVLHVSKKGNVHSWYEKDCLECEYEEKGLNYWEEINAEL